MFATHFTGLISFALGWLAFGQVYEITDREVPDTASLEALQAFYVDHTASSSVRFQRMEAHVTGTQKSDKDLSQYQGLQISLIELEQFWKIVDPTNFCSAHQQLDLLPKAKDGDVFSETVPVGVRVPQTNPHSFKNSGIYYLILSNCGDFSNMTMSVDVVIEHSHGYLPANEYPKMKFYFFMTVLYLVVGIVWTVLSCKYKQNLIGIQFSIIVIIGLGLFECMAWYIFLWWWNQSGIHSQTFLALTLYLSVAKRLYSFMIVLVASMGWGVTRPTMDSWTQVKIFIASSLYFVVSLFQELVLFFRHSLLLKTNFLALCSLPVTCWCAIAFFWIFKELSDTIAILREREEVEKLDLFQKFRAVLIGIFTVGSLNVLFQAFDTYRSASIRWYYQWFPNVGVSHIVFFMVLVTFVILWAPHAASDVYAYSKQVGDEQDAAEDESLVHAVDGDEDDPFDRIENSVAPDKIGVPDD